jgi:hypothetical protein
MATIFKKTGFWPFEKTTHHLICDRCNEELFNDILLDPDFPAKRYCRRCAISLGLDLEPHDWAGDADILDTKGAEQLYNGFIDNKDGQLKYIKGCFHCNSLMVATIYGVSLDKKYYTISTEKGNKSKPKCNRIEKEFVGGHEKSQLICRHNFVEIASSRVREVQEKIISKAFGDSQKVTTVNEVIESGYRFMWCTKCGLFHRLPSYRDSELKPVGINTEWYV